jgi:hypothetical protein
MWFAVSSSTNSAPGISAARILPALSGTTSSPRACGTSVGTRSIAGAHLVFSIMTTVYILLAIQLEERDLVAEHGAAYEDYRRRVPMLVPGTARRASASRATLGGRRSRKPEAGSAARQSSAVAPLGRSWTGSSATAL